MAVNKPEIVTQKRIIDMFKNPDLLGYTYLGDWKNRENSNIEKELLEKFLKDKYDTNVIKDAIAKIEKIATDQNKSIYEINKEVYSLLRYGISVKKNTENDNLRVWLIDWKNPNNNHFYIAEEVTINGTHTKRPDIVLYVNGIALVVLELKRSSVSVEEGIRQNLDNQKSIFIKNFFATIQLVMAGNDSAGLRYGVIETEEKYYLTWKEETIIQRPLDNHLYAMCQKDRLLEIIHDFIVFDGIKKICRHNQYFGVKKAQESLKKEEGGIIWHTQGSGKSLFMIWLAKWIRENRNNKPRVLVITDRKELDDQIESFFVGVNEKIVRTISGKDLVDKLDKNDPWLICSLIHKFKKNNNPKDDDHFEDIFSNLNKDFKAKGNLHVFIDECHRTQSGKLHAAMKKLIPNAIIIGFTGTPLLKSDKQTTLEKFGKYIHTYKYDEAVTDKVILDLLYEARDIEQTLSSSEKIDQWFEASTKGLTDFKKKEIKKKWGTERKIFSSKQRLEKIVMDIKFDMKIKGRLLNGRGNAILIASSIYQACRYYDIFQRNGFEDCAIITSYTGDINSIKGETIGGQKKTEKENMYEIYKKMLSDYNKKGIGGNEPEKFEREVKKLFVKEPERMKLLIVVNKLLTGFDAPPATYLYIDKTMNNHGLFQAICRINRLDGEDKEYGYIVDYKDLFYSIEKTMAEYTTDAFAGFDSDDIRRVLQNRISTERKKLDETLEQIQALCDPVKPPKKIEEYFEYFCGSSNELDNLKKLKETSQRRVIYYKITSTLVRAYASMANDMQEAGYSKEETKKIKSKVKDYEGIKKSIMLRSGEFVDLKSYEPDMRQLIDNYVNAGESKIISYFGDLTLVDLIVKTGISEMINNLPEQVRKNKKNVADIINANVRKIITKEKDIDPAWYEKMSTILDEIIRTGREDVLVYEAYLKKITELCKMIHKQNNIKIKAIGSLCGILDGDEEIAIKIHEAIIKNKPDSWKGNRIKEKIVKQFIEKVLKQANMEDAGLVEKILNLAIAQKEY